MFQNYLHQFILISGLYCFVISNPYLQFQHNSYYSPNSGFYSPYPDKYYVSQSRQIQSFTTPKWSNYQKSIVSQPRNHYRVWGYQTNNAHNWPIATSYHYDPNQQVQSASYNRPIYRKQNHIKKSTGAISYQKKMEFLENKKKKSQPMCKRIGETCYGWEPYIPENCCKGHVCDHATKSIIGVCQKKVSVKPLTSKQSNMVQRPLTTEELLAGGSR